MSQPALRHPVRCCLALQLPQLLLERDDFVLGIIDSQSVLKKKSLALICCVFNVCMEPST